MAEEGERLQKVLAHLGVASRRAAEEMILAGRVTVNGKVVTELGTRADATRDEIIVDGRPLPRPEAVERVTYILNKPIGVVSTASDPQGRQTVVDLVPPTTRVYPVGRLDVESDGLILLTNDGELAQQMMHPSHEVEKEYEALVRGQPTINHLRQLRHGIMLEGEDRPTAPARVQVISQSGDETLLRFIVHEGRNRQVRRMAEAVGLYILRLKRVRIGPLLLGDLPPGKWRRLSGEDLRALRAALQSKNEAAAKAAPRAARPKPAQRSPQQEQNGTKPPGATPRPERRRPGQPPAPRPRRPGQPPAERERRPVERTAERPRRPAPGPAERTAERPQRPGPGPAERPQRPGPRPAERERRPDPRPPAGERHAGPRPPERPQRFGPRPTERPPQPGPRPAERERQPNPRPPAGERRAGRRPPEQPQRPGPRPPERRPGPPRRPRPGP